MGHLSAVSICIVLCVTVVQILGQACRPEAVQNLTLTDELILSWEPPSNESCTINHYDIFIRSSVTTDYAYSIINKTLPVNFLRICDEYRIAVAAVSSDNLDSTDAVLYARVPIPEGESAYVDSVDVGQFEQGLYVGWTISRWTRCLDMYTIYTYENDKEPVILNSTYPYLSVSDVVPCSQYMFGVEVQTNYGDTVIVGPLVTSNFTVAPLAQSAPTVSNVTVGTTTVNMTLTMEGYTTNMCSIVSVIVDASPSFTITIPVEDDPSRPPVSINLSDLTPETIYVLNITVVNSAGPSAPVMVAVLTQPSS